MRSTLRFWMFTHGRRRWMVAAGVACLLLPLIETAEIWLYKELVDDVLVPGNLAPLATLVVSYLALQAASSVLSYTDDVASAIAREGFGVGLRSHIFAQLVRLSPMQIGRQRPADLIIRMGADVADVERILVGGPALLIEQIVRAIAFSVMLFVLDPILAVVALAATPVFWLVARRFSAPIRQLARERRSRLADLFGHAEEVIGATAQVQASRAETHERRRFDRHSRSVGRLGVETTRVTARLSPIVDGVELAAALLVISLGAWSVTEGRITVGGLIAFLTYLTQMYSPVRALTSFVADIQRAAAGAERISGVLDEEPLVVSPSHASHPTIGSGRLVVEGVTVGYAGRERPALVDVDMVFEPGTTTAIVGPSGSGKSTLVSLLVRFMDPDLGRVTLDGHDLRDLPLTVVRGTVGLLPQESYLFRGTIAENVAYGTEAVDDVVSAYLDAVGASFVSSLPDGMQSRVDCRGHGLSGGERRRIAIARLLTQRPRVLVLDEFTNGLDREAVTEVLTWLDGHVETVDPGHPRPGGCGIRRLRGCH